MRICPSGFTFLQTFLLVSVDIFLIVLQTVRTFLFMIYYTDGDDPYIKDGVVHILLFILLA